MRTTSNLRRAFSCTHGAPASSCTHSSPTPSATVAATPCRHEIARAAGVDVTCNNESVFDVDANRLRFGAGVLREAGDAAGRALGMRRAALFSDPRVRQLECFDVAHRALCEAGVDVVVYDEVLVEPTDVSFEAAARFATEGAFDGFVSVGGGSVMDTAKAANLLSSCPPRAGVLEYANAPVGEGRCPPDADARVRPHVACPTTAGTGSEVTPIAIFDLLSRKCKTGIAMRPIRPTLALVDPTVTATMPAAVTACSGFDVLSHAIESYTAVPYDARARPASPAERPLSQGRNPWSDVGALEALRVIGANMERAVADPADSEARHAMMWASTLAGIAFGNAGVHLPHGLSYAVAGLVGGYCPDGYDRPAGHPHAGHLEGMVPHGMSVILNAPACFRFTAGACPDRHLRAAEALGADVRGAGPGDAGEVLAGRVVELMQACAMPSGLRAVGYGEGDIGALVDGAWPQQRLLSNAPVEVQRQDLSHLFGDAMQYW
eukprot:g6179.t1